MKYRALPLSLLALLASCATQSIRVPVLKPAPVDLVSYDRIAVDRFEGEGCELFSDQLAAALGNAVNPMTGKQGFTVLHRKDIDKALDQIRDRRGDQWDKRTMEMLDQWRTAQVVLKGQMQQHQVAQEETWEKVRNSKGHDVQRRKQVVTARVTVRLEVTDLEGNRVFDSVTMTGSACATRRPDEDPRSTIDPLPLLQQARAQVVQSYLDRVLPHQEWVEVNLYTDSDFPDLQLGNGCAEVGNWTMAMEAYQRALQGMTGPHQGVRYKGLFNYGVACEFTDRFDEAKRALQEAYALGREQMILGELQRTTLREDEVRRLRTQGSRDLAQPQR